MREEVRYRVTGSLFLLAVAVICLPMLLDGAGLPGKRLPDLPMNETLPEVRPLAEQAPQSDFVTRVEELRRQVDEDGFLTGSGTRFGEPVLTPGEEHGEGGGEATALWERPPGRESEARWEQPPGREGEARDQEVAPTGPGDRSPRRGVQTDAWAVQVASFSRAANAEAFRARLRKDGYEAFISTARLRGEVLSRVAVGPLLDRQRAESLRHELSARYDLRARLMAFSN